uniref:CASPASE_P20 domain-containing protein n=1 Tax=Macrostomum lignano TaxID=282301 RepID=A0A1I8FMW1_9PLAT
MIDLLVDAEGIRLDAARKLDRRTALHIAASHGCCDGVRRLLEAGAGIDVRDRDGNTPVFLAVQNNKHRVVHELVSQGANLKLKNNGLQTCLAFAMKQSQDKAMIKLLVERKSTMAPQPGTSRQAAVRATRIDNAAQHRSNSRWQNAPEQIWTRGAWSDYLNRCAFTSRYFKNLDAKDIYWNLSNYCQESDHSGYDCYVCCILSHGTLGGIIYGVDDEEWQKLSDLTVMLSSNTNCPSLAGKPKTVLYPGLSRPLSPARRAPFHHAIATPGHDPDGPTRDATRCQPARPKVTSCLNHGDFLIGYATVAQHIAQRHRSRAPCTCRPSATYRNAGRHKEDLLSLLTKVKYPRVRSTCSTMKTAACSFRCREVKETLRKKI